MLRTFSAADSAGARLANLSKFDIPEPFNTLTLDSGIVGFHVGALDFAILNHQRVTLATVLTEDSSAIEGEVEVFGELTGRVTQEADLYFLKTESVGRRMAWRGEGREFVIHQSWRWGQESHPRLSCYTVDISCPTHHGARQALI